MLLLCLVVLYPVIQFCIELFDLLRNYVMFFCCFSSQCVNRRSCAPVWGERILMRCWFEKNKGAVGFM